jgi:hypothetical protein
MRRAAIRGRFAGPGARLVAVAIAVGASLVVQVIVLVWGGVLAARGDGEAVDDSFAYLADVSQELVVAYAQATHNVADEPVKALEVQDPGVLGVFDTLRAAVTSRSQVDAAAALVDGKWLNKGATYGA